MEQPSEAISFCLATPQIRVCVLEERLETAQNPGPILVNRTTEFSLHSTQLSGVRLGLILKLSYP